MKVRVKQHYNKMWHVEVWRWWWPFWWRVDGSRSFDDAKDMADMIKNPTFLDVQ